MLGDLKFFTYIFQVYIRFIMEYLLFKSTLYTGHMLVVWLIGMCIFRNR